MNTSNYDIICIQETWLSSVDLLESYLQNTNYCGFIQNRATRGGGVAVVVKKSFEVIESWASSNHGFELCGVKIKLNNATHLAIWSTYTPPELNKSIKLQRIQEMHNFISSTFSDNDIIIIAGDYNVPFINWWSKCV